MTKKIQLNFAIFVLAFIILGSILAPLLATHNPFEPDMANRLQSPAGSISSARMLWGVTCSAVFFTVAGHPCF